jgi:hypothetical protein
MSVRDLLAGAAAALIGGFGVATQRPRASWPSRAASMRSP